MKARVIEKDHGLRGMFEAVAAMHGKAFCKVGILGDSTRGGLHQPGAALTIAEIAVVNEFGTADGHIPARPFVRPTYDRMRPELESDLGKLLVQILFDGGKMTVERALNIVGLKLATGIRKYVTEGEGVPPPNAGAPGNPRPWPSTYQAKLAAGHWNRKGKAAALGPRPLVDTGAMINALSWAVVMGGSEKEPKYLTGGAP